MTMCRQVQLRRGTASVNLNTAPYSVTAPGWTNAGSNLEIGVLVQASTLAELDRYVSVLQRWVGQAELVEQTLGPGLADAVYVYTKTVDDLTATAELGATWQVKRVQGGSVVVPDVSESATGVYRIRVVLSLQVEESWRRAAPVSGLEIAAADVTVRSDGGLTVADTKYLTARRISWTAAGGVTVRVRWIYADSDITFVRFSTDYEARALYLASDNKVYMYDNAGHVASSAALTAAAGDEVDLVFVWDPVTPRMKLWVNGVVGSTTASQCEIGFSTTGSDLVTQGGFEAGGTGGNFNGGTEADDGTSDTFTGWTNADVNDGAGDKVEATATKQAGSYAVKITRTLVASSIYQDIAVTAGKSYRLVFYTRGDGSVAGRYSIYDVTNSAVILDATSTGVTGSSFTAVSDVFMAPAGCASVRIIFVSASTAGGVYYDAVTLYEVDAAGNVDTYRLANPTGVSAQSVVSLQVWATPLTDAQCAGLAAWGRPEPELLAVAPPADTKNTNGKYLLYNVPGSAGARLRLVLDGDAQDYAQVKVGLRPLAAVTTLAWECEAGTNGDDTLDAVDASASGGNVAQWTPDDQAYATRTTLVLAANPADVAALRGKYRLYLQCKDSAATANYNKIKWRLVVAGQNEEYSEEFAVVAIGTYSLLDLGTVEIPPGTWPAESISASTDVHAGSYITLEIAGQNLNTGAFDFDAVYLAPAEMEGTWLGTFDVSAWYELLDFTGERPSAVGMADPRSMEFAAWGAYTGDVLELPPAAGAGGTLFVRWLRSSAEECYANDTCDVWVFVEPRWV